MSALWLSLDEKDPRKQNAVIQQLTEGRSNATGTLSLATSGTVTTVTAATCGAGSAVFLSPQSAAAASASAYVASTDVTPKQFIVHHSSSTSSRTFYWVALG